MRKAYRWSGLGLLLILGGVLGGTYYLTNRLIFPYRPQGWWDKAQAPDCEGHWVQDAFSDMRAGPNQGKPLDMSCAQALTETGEDDFVTNAIGWRIHYRVYPSSLAGAPPLWLHVHGVTGNYLHGTRYLQAAQRLGFQLVAMDLSNHGLSQHDGAGAAYGCREKADVAAVFADLVARYPGREILITGSSMGSMSVQAAAPALIDGDTNHRLIAVALESAIPSVRGVVFEGLQTPPVPGMFLDLGVRVAGLRAGYDFDACAAKLGAAALTRPTLIQQPGADQLVPETLARQVFDALPLKDLNVWRTYPNGKHSQAWNYAPDAFEADLKQLWKVGLAYRETTAVGAKSAGP